MFFNTHPAVRDDATNLGMASFAALCVVLDLLVSCKEGLLSADDAAGRLDVAIARFYAAHQRAYGTDVIKPKHHWLTDIPDQLRRDGLLLDAFVIERQHLFVKSVAEAVDNTSHYEESVIASLLVLQIQQAEGGGSYYDGLIGSTSRLEGFGPSVRVANKLTIGCFRIAVDDFVVRDRDLGVVVACAADDGELLLIVDTMAKVADVTKDSVQARSMGVLAVWRGMECRETLAWRRKPDGSVLVVLR